MASSRRGRGSRHLAWALFQKRIDQGPPSIEPIPGRPKAQLFITAGGGQVGLRINGAPAALPASPLAELTLRSLGSGPAAVVEIATANRDLYREFYQLCCAVADRVQLDGEEIGAALATTLESWNSLLRKMPTMSPEKEVGLLGELWFLGRLARARGWKSAVEAWRGPDAEEHDFTLARIDVEVKTTRKEARVHTIGSLTQLLPKVKRPLYLLSVQVTPGSTAKGSLTLPHLVAEVMRASTSVGIASGASARRLIERYGWQDDAAALYSQPWVLRTKPTLSAVDRSFPAIVRKSLHSLGEKRLARIGRVTYDIDVEDLGVIDGTQAFESLITR